MKARIAAVARRHPGLTYVAVPCTVLLLLVLALWPAPQESHPFGSAAGAELIAQDRPAPDFSRPLVAGTGELSLQELRGNVVVVNFWASWCTACRSELPRLRALSRANDGVVFLGVDEQDTRSRGQDMIRKVRPGYRNVFDPDGSLLHVFGSIGVPSTFILDRVGRIRYEAFGEADSAALGAAIATVVR